MIRRGLFGETRHARRPRLEIVPMIDVMLLLLVFYILSSVALSRDQAIPVHLPKASTGTADSGPDVTVTITKRGDYYVNKKIVRVQDLAAAVKAVGDRLPGGMKTLEEKGVVINADMSVQHRLVVTAMDTLREINITHFGIATDPLGGKP